jgi:hypothetical protein
MSARSRRLAFAPRTSSGRAPRTAHAGPATGPGLVSRTRPRASAPYPGPTEPCRPARRSLRRSPPPDGSSPPGRQTSGPGGSRRDRDRKAAGQRPPKPHRRNSANSPDELSRMNRPAPHSGHGSSVRQVRWPFGVSVVRTLSAYGKAADGTSSSGGRPGHGDTRSASRNSRKPSGPLCRPGSIAVELTPTHRSRRSPRSYRMPTTSRSAGGIYRSRSVRGPMSPLSESARVTRDGLQVLQFVAEAMRRGNLLLHDVFRTHERPDVRSRRALTVRLPPAPGPVLE